MVDRPRAAASEASGDDRAPTVGKTRERAVFVCGGADDSGQHARITSLVRRETSSTLLTLDAEVTRSSLSRGFLLGLARDRFRHGCRIRFRSPEDANVISVLDGVGEHEGFLAVFDLEHSKRS